MLATHVDAEQRYSRLRREALAVASEVLKDAGDARRRLSEINPEALFASDNISDFEGARRERLLKKGWTKEKIKRLAEKELKEFRKISADEPSDLTSGNMDQLLQGDDDDEK